VEIMPEPHPVQYRPLNPGDLGAALRIWAESSPDVELGKGDSPDELGRYLARNPGLSQAAFLGPDMIGAVLAGHDGRRGLLYHLAVLTSHRGSGIGRQLVDRSLAALRAEGITRVLILVLRDNHVGNAFWGRQGWEIISGADPLFIDL
jgi:ribosomal protein S18 acetylase RimI-like enzyme